MVGRQIVVDGILREVIGVMPANFRFLDRDAAFLLPLQFDRNKAFLGQFDYPGIARLKPGATMEQASADIARMIPIALHTFPPQTGLTVKTCGSRRSCNTSNNSSSAISPKRCGC